MRYERLLEGVGERFHLMRAQGVLSTQKDRLNLHILCLDGWRPGARSEREALRRFPVEKGVMMIGGQEGQNSVLDG
jgi:hypothetical protein